MFIRVYTELRTFSQVGIFKLAVWSVLSPSLWFNSPPLSPYPCVNKYIVYTYIGGGGDCVLGLRLINTCRKVPLQVNFFRCRHFTLPSMILIFLRPYPSTPFNLHSQNVHLPCLSLILSCPFVAGRSLPILAVLGRGRGWKLDTTMGHKQSFLSTESIATLPPFGSTEGHKWFFRFPAN